MPNLARQNEPAAVDEVKKREAYRKAIASVRMEGGILSPLFFEGMERIIKGEITVEEEIANLAIYYKNKENA